MERVIYWPGGPSNTDRWVREYQKAILSGQEGSFLCLFATWPLLDQARRQVLDHPEIHGASLDGFFLFDGLVDRILSEAGGGSRVIDAVTKEIILREVVAGLLREGRLPYFAAVAGYPGFVRSLAGLIGEIKRAGAGPEAFAAAGPKGEEVARIYSEYQSRLTAAGLADGDDRYLLALNRSEVPGARNYLGRFSVLVVDGFLSFTPVQLRVLKTVAGIIPGLFLNLYPELPKASEGLRDLSDLGAKVILAETDALPPRGSSAASVHAPGAAFKPIIIRAPGSEAEIHEVARQAKRLLVEDPSLTPDDIAVVFREAAPYRQTVRRAFGGQGLPIRVDPAVPLDSVPVIRAVLKALRAAVSAKKPPGPKAAEVVDLIKSGYLSWWEGELGDGRRPDPDAVEDVVLRLGGNLDVRAWEVRAKQEEGAAESREKPREARAIRAARRAVRSVFAHLALLPASGNCETLVSAVRVLIDGFQVARLGTDFLRHRPDDFGLEVVARDLKALKAFDGCLDLVIEGVNGAGQAGLPLGLEAFAEMVAEACGRCETEGFSSGAFGAGAPGVRVISASEARGLCFRAVFVAGLVEGEFPKAFRPDWLFSDAEREELGRRGVPLECRVGLVAREGAYFRHAVSCAAEKLYLSYPVASEDGRETMPSHFLGDLPSPAAVIEAPPAHRRWPERFDPVSVPGFQAKAVAEAEREGASYGAWDGVLSQPAIAAELAARFGDGFLWSAGWFKDFGTCPFMFYCGRVLGLTPREDAGDEAGGLEVGDLYHRILQRFFLAHRGERLGRDKLAECREEMAGISEEVFREFESGGSSFHPGLWEIKKAEMRGRLSRLLEYEVDVAEATGGQLRPAFFELEFGTGETPALALEREGDRLYFRGKIDRIDAGPGGRFVVYDYKTSGTPDLKMIREGMEFQIPLYIRAAVRCLPSVSGVDLCEPIGGAYYSIRDLNRNAGIWKAEYRDLTGISKQAKSNLDAGAWEGILSSTEEYLWTYAGRIRAGRFPVAPKDKCPDHCNYRSICRFDRRRLDRKEDVHG